MTQSPQHTGELTQIGHYTILSNIGRGGMGLVYLARDSRLDRHVAIKCLRTELIEPHYRERFKREALLLAKLNHPNIVQIYDYVETDTQLALVMEYVDGENLQQHLREHIVPHAQRMQWLAQIAEGLAVAHDAGIIHRDLKAENILINTRKLAKITDLGIAKSQDYSATLTDHVTGSYCSMSPEQAMGEELDFRSDLFSFGILAYQLLCGAHPFGETDNKLQLMQRIISHPAISPLKKNPDLPPEVVELLGQLLSKNPSNRPASTHWVAAQCAKLYQVMALAVAVETDLTQRLPHSPNDTNHTLKRNPHTSQEHATFDLAPAAAPKVHGLAKRTKTLAVVGVTLAILASGLAWQEHTAQANDRNPTNNNVAATAPYSQVAEFNQGLEALKLFDRPGSLEEAETRFNTILSHTPKNAAAVAGLSLVYSYRYSGDSEDPIWLQKADASAQQALSLNAQLALAHVALGRVLTLKAEHTQALTEFATALTLEPTNIFAWRGKVAGLYWAQRYDEAIQLAQQGLAKFPQERFFADELGTAYIDQHDYAKAEEAFRLSIQLQPDAVYAYSSLYIVLERQNRPDAAMQVLQQGLQIRSSATLYGNLGAALFLRGDYVGAVAAFEAAVSPTKGNPKSHLAWANLADTLLWIPGREAEAQQAYRTASELLRPLLARRKEDATLLSRMGLYTARLGDHAQATPLLSRVIALAPKDASVHFRAGLAYELLGNREAAVRALTQALTLGYPLKLIQAEPDLLELRRTNTAFQ